MFRILNVAAVTALIGGAALAQDDLTQACFEQLRAVGGPDGESGSVLDTDWSQAGTMIHLRDAGGTVWECIAYDDGTVGDMRIVSAADDGGGAMSGRGDPADYEPETVTETVKFHRGHSGATYNGHLVQGASHRYVLGANDGQMLYVTVTPDHGKVEYQIFNPDDSFLLDLIDSRHPYQGQLWQSGNHVVEIVNRGAHTIGYKVEFSIR